MFETEWQFECHALAKVQKCPMWERETESSKMQGHPSPHSLKDSGVRPGIGGEPGALLRGGCVGRQAGGWLP